MNYPFEENVAHYAELDIVYIQPLNRQMFVLRHLNHDSVEVGDTGIKVQTSTIFRYFQGNEAL